jgi:hypothetical protein
VVRQVDSSLLDEWERLRHPEELVVGPVESAEPLAPDITRDRRAFDVLVRNEVFRFVRSVALGHFDRALDVLSQPDDDRWDEARLVQAMAPFFAEYDTLRTDQEARSKKNVLIEDTDEGIRVDQILLDPEDDRAYCARFFVDLAQSREEQRPVLRLSALGADATN